MIIRKVNPDDVEDIMQISSENTLNEHEAPHKRKTGFLVSNFTRQEYDTFINQNELFYVLVDEGVIQGFLLAFHDHEVELNKIVNKRIHNYAKNSYILLKQICIRKSAHKKGYGRKLYECFMSTVHKDIFLAVVLEPYNEASILFHNKLGYTQVFTVNAEDHRKRGVFFWNNPHNDSPYDKDVIIAQYEFALDLYKHEDNLNWSKINHLFYITGALFGIISLLANVLRTNYDLLFLSLFFVSVFGIVAAVMFEVAISNGILYLQRRKQSVVDIENILKYQGGVAIVSVNITKTDRSLRRSPTTSVMKLFPRMIIIIWSTILLASIIAFVI